MNQAILFNDDLTLIKAGIWQISGFYQGELLTFHIKSSLTELDDGMVFDWEERIEDWLGENEIEQSPIILDFT